MPPRPSTYNTKSIYERLASRITIPGHSIDANQLQNLLKIDSHDWPEDLQNLCWIWDIERPVRAPYYRAKTTKVLTYDGPRLIQNKTYDIPRLSYKNKQIYVSRLMRLLATSEGEIVDWVVAKKCHTTRCTNPHHFATRPKVNPNAVSQDVEDLAEYVENTWGLTCKYATLEEMREAIGTAWDLDDYRQAIIYGSLDDYRKLL